jgi:hypothetical protein
MLNKRARGAILIGAASLLSSVCFGRGPGGFPADSGFSGNVSIGATWLSVASNFATDKSRLGEDDIDSLDEQGSTQSAVLGFPRIDLEYTFAESGWQLHLGNAALDFYRFDRANVAGVRKNLGDVGIIGLGYVFSAMPDYVWEDPYRTDGPRDETRRGSAGARLTWENIGGSPVGFRYTQRNIRVGDEFSGSDAGLDFTQQQKLRRDGTQQVAELNMFVPMGKGRAVLPALTYIRNDREGEAVSNDSIMLTVVYRMPLSTRWTLLAEIAGGRLRGAGENPVFGETENNTRLGAALTVKYSKLFGLDPMSLVVRSGSYQENSNIDFHSGDIASIGAFIGYDF